MASGKYTLNAPHICGELIPVEIVWSSTMGSYWEPPEHDVEYVHVDRCPKCGVDLYYDSLFMATIEHMDYDEVSDRGEYVPGDEIDYDPDDDPPF